MIVRISKEIEFDYLLEILGNYYIHGDQITSSLERRIQGVKKFIKSFKKILLRHPKLYVSNINLLAMMCFLKGETKWSKKLLVHSLKYK